MSAHLAGFGSFCKRCKEQYPGFVCPDSGGVGRVGRVPGWWVVVGMLVSGWMVLF